MVRLVPPESVVLLVPRDPLAPLAPRVTAAKLDRKVSHNIVARQKLVWTGGGVRGMLSKGGRR